MNPHGLPSEPKSDASANFAISALVQIPVVVLLIVKEKFCEYVIIKFLNSKSYSSRLGSNYIVCMYVNIDPVIFYIAGYPILRWYSVAYILGFICGYLLFKKFAVFADAKQREAIFNYSFLGVVIGGRLGYCLFYNTKYYLHNPLEILQVWHGGMSFHGGLIGVAVALIICTKIHNIDIKKVMDIAPLCITPGLFFGRIANFINGELWGSVTTLPIGFVFPQSGTMEPRHATQLYEAISEGLVIFIIMYILYRRKSNDNGTLFGLFLILYGVFRFLIEFIREPDLQIGYLLLNTCTMGHILCSLMVICGIIICIKFRHKA